MITAQKVLERFKVAVHDRSDELQVEIDEIEELIEDLEGFVFMEEAATTVMHKARELARKYPDLAAMSREVQSGLQDYHTHVLNDLSAALGELDEAHSRRVDEREELHESLRR
jgi:hypothetical protein